MEHLSTTNLWLIRHGEPVVEKPGVCCVAADAGLSANGRSQMASVGEYLKSEPVAAVYCSPLQRALESARILASIRGCPLEVVTDLRELDFGDFSGLTFDEISARDAEFSRGWLERPASVKFPNGEGYHDMRVRVLKAIDGIKCERAGQMCVIVSHAGVNRLLISHALAMPESTFFRLGQDYAAVNLLRFFVDVPSVELVNWRPIRHQQGLTGPGVQTA